MAYRRHSIMKAVEWEKIRRNLDKLTDVNFNTILPALIKFDLLDMKDKEELQAISSNEDRMTQLCNILKGLPHEKNGFHFLLKALRTTELPYESDIADSIESTETTSDPAVVSKVNPRHSEDNVRKVLNKYFTEKLDAETALSDFKKMLSDERVFSADCSWTDEKLCSFIEAHFVRADLIKKDTSSGNHPKMTQFVKNVVTLEIPEEATHSSVMDSSDLHSDTCQDVSIKLLTPAKLRSFLEKKNVETKVLDALEWNEICGKVFISLTEQDLEKILPNVTFGCKRKLALMIEDLNKFLKSKTDPAEEILRVFNKSLKVHDFYTRGKLVDVTFHIAEKKTSRIKNFHLIENQSSQERCENIAIEVIQFAAACMNSRRNGTIYFGICSQACQLYRVGEVVGMTVLKDDLQKELDYTLNHAFHKDQLEIVQNVIKPVKFIPVHAHDRVDVEQKDRLWVIEYDIVSSNDILQEESFTVNPYPFPCLRKKHNVVSCIFSFSNEGIPKVLNYEEERDFNAEKGKIVNEREIEEMTKSQKVRPNLHNRLHKVVTGGCQSLEDNIFPFLMLGPLAEEQEIGLQEDDISFVKYLHPEVVFDFNEKGSSSEIYNQLDLHENFRVLTTDNFDLQKSKKEEIHNLSATLADEKYCRWVFCNGDEPNDMKPLKALQWNKQRKSAFQEAMKSHLEIFKKERILLIICLFSQNDEAIVEASCEMLTHLPDQWILLAESERAMQTWKNAIIQRNMVEEEDVSDRCIVGMTWKQVSDYFKDLSSVDVDFNMCQIPHSNGSPIKVKEKLMKSWCDVEVVSLTDPVSPNEDEDIINKKARKVEEYFYRGGEVQWLNFHFRGQVLERTILQHLKKDVETALRGDKRKYENKVTCSVYFYHQPGAGGTTVAKHVMWELRKEYRCCVVLDVTDQTCEQLEEIYLLDDDQPKPLLLFLDNIENEKINKLEYHLEKLGSNIQKRFEGASDIFCVLLICSCHASLPLEKHSHDLKYLRQELDSEESRLFKSKSEALEERHKNNRLYENPRFLISFNLLKQNFNRTYLRKIVEEFTGQITADHEISIMKIVTLLNTFDCKFRPIPVSCFDIILGRAQLFLWTDKSQQHRCLSRRIFWEANLSQSFKVLLNMSSGNNRKRTVRVFNKLMAEEILETLRRTQKVTSYEITLQILQSRVFEEDDCDIKLMQKIIRDVLIMRQINSKGKKGSFSEFITSIRENEGVEKALNILQSFLYVKRDAFVAQQIARLNIEIKSFEDAKKCMQYATDLIPNNSFIWNTYGQLFLNQLMDRIEVQESNVKSPYFTDDDVVQLIFLFQNCLYYFTKSQTCAEIEMEKIGQKLNLAGYFDELRSTQVFLSALERSQCFRSPNVLHDFLVNPDYDLQTTRFLKTTDVHFIKSIASDSIIKIQKLEEELLCPKFEQNKHELESYDHNENLRTLIKIRVKLDDYFGESQNFFPAGLSEQKACEFRYRRAISKLPKTLNALLKSDQPMNMIESSFRLVYDNVKCEYRSFLDLKTFLDFFTVIMVKNSKVLPRISMEEIQHLSKELCFKQEFKSATAIFLEKFFYCLLFNFPSEERILSVTAAKDLISVAENLKKVFLKKHSKTNDGALRIARPLFYLGHGSPAQFKHLVYYKDLKGVNLNDIQQKPKLVKILKILTGTLQKDGTQIRFFVMTCENKKVSMDILTANRIRKRALWQKMVDFYLGFSFAGLQAFGIVPHDPEK